MNKSLSRKSIINKTFQVGGNTLLSRVFGLVRERLLMTFLGVGAAADAFNAAFLIPNSLRKMFAEGALTAAFVPTYVNVLKNEGVDQANRLMTLAALFFEGLVLILCCVAIWQPEQMIYIFFPGFAHEQLALAVVCLKILMPFIFFISSSSLIAGALQSVHHFFVPSFASVILNIFFIGGTLICITYGYAVDYLCWAVMAGGVAQFIMHVVMYQRLGFGLSLPTAQSYSSFYHVLKKFVPCFFSMSVMEINLIVDNVFASYEHVGTVTLIKYTSRLMGIPAGVFSTAFSTILLPHFSRVAMYAPLRLSFYLFESAKFIFWVTIPVTLIMSYLSDDIFLTLFASGSKKFDLNVIPEAGWMLIGYVLGLFWISINKMLLSIFYAFHDTKTPTYTAIIATVLNYLFCYVFVGWWGGMGIPFATTLSGVVQVVVSMYLLRKYHNFKFYGAKFFEFASRYTVQLALFFIGWLGMYKLVRRGVEIVFTNLVTYQKLADFMLSGLGYWIWAGPIILIYFYALYVTRSFFKIKVYFLSKN